jgi:hypothetical protein
VPASRYPAWDAPIAQGAGAKYLQVRAAAECGQSTWSESPLAT